MSMSDIGDDVTAAVVIQQQRQQQHHHQQQQQQQQQQTTLAQLQQQELVNLNIMPVLTSDNEIINIPKEIILISLVSQEQALYNPKHENYRNAQHKDGKWLDIADNVGWTEIQCKSKWKAMRDQYCRELKRSKFNAKANVKWKYFKELEFLRPYALSRNYRPRHVNSNVNNNNINNNINNNSITNNNNSNSNNNLNSVNKFANIKIEPGPFGSCDFTTAVVTTTSTNTNVTSIKNEPVRLLTPLTDEQLNSVMQQQQQQQQVDGNWSYLTAATTTLTSTSMQQQQQQHQQQQQQQQQQNATSSDEALLSAFVNCVAAVTATQNNNNNDLQQTQQQQQQQQHLLVQNVQQTPHTTTMDEEDDDPIHTFLNIESYFEKELIAMIQQHDILYNRYHPNYRNVKRKLEVWDEIARKLKKTVKQCRLKWKAFRDQYIREHKRLKNRENAESLPRWKHYDALSFLQKYIKHKSDDATEPKSLMQISKTALNITDMDEQLIDSSPLNISPLRSPTLPETLTELNHQQQQQQHDQLQLHALPSLTGPHTQQQQQQQQQNTTTTTTHDDDDDEAMCAAVGTSNGTDDNDDAGSVTGYDEMDIDTYIIGDESNEPTTRDDVDGEVSDTATAAMIDEPNDAEDDVDKEKSPARQFVTAYSQHSEQSLSNQQIIDKFDELKTMTPDATKVQLKIEEINVVMGNDIVDVVLDGTMQQTAQQQQQSNFLLNNSGQCSVGATTTTTNTTATLLLNGNNNNTSNNNNNSNNGQHISIDTTTNATTTTTNNNNNLSNGMATPNGISPNINSVSVAATTVMPITTTSTAAAAVVATTTTPATVTSDDDEVGAFFKAVAMKIRNAKMSPIAFTDLQIEILRVINGSLRQY